ncbi:MAG: HAD family phosphatase [Lachnospiraceae bacterium]|nr:HAD family phosphatase [Lachnospiraceae bacterium]
MIRQVVFDMGNVLLQFRPWIALEEFFETPEDREIIERELFNGPEWIMGDEGIITNEERYERILPRIPAHLHEAFKRCIDGWDMCLSPVPGASAFCDTVRKKGYGMYVLSNACNRFHHFFSRYFPRDFFDGVMVSSDVKMIKPNPEIYRHLCSVYGLKPEECLFVDDRPENVKAAISIGMEAVVFQDDWDEVEKRL